MMLKSLAPIAFAAALTAGCVTTPHYNPDGSFEARMGQRVNLNGTRITVIKVLEDSRCPMEARCVWAGRVRLNLLIELGGKTSERELTSDEPLMITGDAMLELVGTMPPKSTQRTLAPSDYRFTLRFSRKL